MAISETVTAANHNQEAARIAMIKAYWADRGYNIEARITSYGFSSTFRSSVLGIKSNMLNGWPQ